MEICNEFAALLDAFVDGELSPEEAVTVQEHLHTCPACQAYVDDALAIRAAFPTVEDTAVPADFADSVMAAIGAQSAPKAKKQPHWGRLMLPLAACFALVLVVRFADPIHLSLGWDAKNEVSALVNDDADQTPEAAMDTAETPEAAKSLPESAEAEAPLPQSPKAAVPDDAEVPPPAEGSKTSRSGEADIPMPATTYSALPETAEETEPTSPYFTQLTLTAQDAGTLLDEFTPVRETDHERVYELASADYWILAGQLAENGVTAPQTTSEDEPSARLALITVLK